MAQQREAIGLNAIADMFEQTSTENRSAFLAFFTIGYPNIEQSIDAIEAMANEGVDGFEIGIPFSDPLADGPTIQVATQVALEQGVTPTTAMDAVRELRNRGVTQPMLMFSYINPVLAYGPEKFVTDSKAAGADGFIIPDLPIEEAHLISKACAEHKMALVFFLTPTTSGDRINMVADEATGFIYVVSVTGVTGERSTLPDNLTAFIARLKERTDKPLVLGFGISSSEQVAELQGMVEGYIVGSALIRAARDAGVEGVRQLAASLRQATN